MSETNVYVTQETFDKMREQLRGDLTGSYSFGITVSIASMVPFLNLLVMPVAVCVSPRTTRYSRLRSTVPTGLGVPVGTAMPRHISRS